MNQKTPRAAAAFMMVTIAMGVAVGLWTSWSAGFVRSQFPAFAILVALGGLAHLYPIRSAQTNVATYEVANTFLFAGAILLSGGWLALMPLVVWIPMTARRFLSRKPDWLLIPLANAAQALVISVVCHALLPGWSGGGRLQAFDVVTLLLVTTLFVFYQSIWVAMVVHLARKIPLRQLEFWKAESLVSEAVLLCLGAIVAVLWQAQPGLLVLVIAPVLFAYYVMRGAQLIRYGEIDGKTGLHNSRRFEEQFQYELGSAKVLRRPLSMVFFDLDFLRDINNNYGHLAGDDVIKGVAERIRNNLRPHDFAARFGGEEFVLLLPGTDILEAQWIAERIRQAVADNPFEINDGQAISCSISGGVAAFPDHGSTLEKLTAAADGALYYAKRQGRNRIHAADDVPAGEMGETKPATRPACPPAAGAEQAERPEAAAAPTAGTADAGAGGAPAAAAAAAASAPAAAPTAPAPPVTTARESGQPGLIEVVILAAAVAALLVPSLLGRSPGYWELLLTLSCIGFAAEYWKVDLLSQGQRHSTVSLGVAVTMAAGATLGMGAAICVNVVNFSAHLLQSRGRQFRILAANLTILCLSAVAGSLSFTVLRNRFTGLNGWFLMAVLSGSLLYFVFNVGLVSLLVAWKQKVQVARLWREHYGWMAPGFIFTAACGGLMGGAYLSMGWVALPVFVLPLVFMYRNYKLHIRQSRQAYETAERGRKALEDAHTLQTQAMDHLIEAVSAIIDARDRSVAGHSFQVARYAVAIGEQMGLSQEELLHLRQAALLHDLGKVGIPEAILQKPARLTPEEWEVMRQHTQIGERILRSIPGLSETARIVGQHHEKYGGKGYPYGLAGEQIALGARIVALCDALDTMLSDRPYSRAKPLAWAIEEINRCAGEHFDPKVVAAFRVLVARQTEGFFVNSAVEGYPSEGLAEVAAAIQL